MFKLIPSCKLLACRLVLTLPVSSAFAQDKSSTTSSDTQVDNPQATGKGWTRRVMKTLADKENSTKSCSENNAATDTYCYEVRHDANRNNRKDLNEIDSNENVAAEVIGSERYEASKGNGIGQQLLNVPMGKMIIKADTPPNSTEPVQIDEKANK